MTLSPELWHQNISLKCRLLPHSLQIFLNDEQLAKFYNRAFIIFLVQDISTSCMPDMAPGTSQTLPLVTFVTTLENKHYYPHYIDGALGGSTKLRNLSNVSELLSCRNNSNPDGLYQAMLPFIFKINFTM